MHKPIKLIISIFVIILIVGGGRWFFVGKEEPPKNEWINLWSEEDRHVSGYNDLEMNEELFLGVVEYQPCEQRGSKLMRCSEYALDGVAIKPTPEDFDRFKGKTVGILGKKHSFSLEGLQLTEIYPYSVFFGDLSQGAK